MTALDRPQAEALYKILDEEIGVFRESEMSTRAEQFYNASRESFMEKFTTSIPESYWFQGEGCQSVSLTLDSTHGFNLSTTLTDHGSKESVAKANDRIRQADLLSELKVSDVTNVGLVAGAI